MTLQSDNFTISSFGGLSFSHNEHIYFPGFGTSLSKLFAYLCVNHNRLVFREVLIEKLWPEKPLTQSRSALNTSLWRLNHCLETHSVKDFISLDRNSNSVSLLAQRPNKVFDFQNLRTCVLEMESVDNKHSHLPAETLSRWITALDRYVGPFHPNLDSHWIVQERERFRCLYIRGCQFMLQYFCETQRYELALSYGRKILKLDELREYTQRQVIWLYVMNGQRNRAKDQFEKLKTLLAEELGVTPMPETLDLYDYIQQQENQTRKISDVMENENKVKTAMASKTEDRASIFRSLSLAF